MCEKLILSKRERSGRVTEKDVHKLGLKELGGGEGEEWPSR